MSKKQREFPELKFSGCDPQVCGFYNEDCWGYHYGAYNSFENRVVLTKCARDASFREIINTINHEYFHWVFDELFPSDTYKDEHGVDHWCFYRNIPDTKFWKNIDVSLGLKYLRHYRWPSIEVDVWDGFIVSAINLMEMVDARVWFK